jgi:hypothetical protein
MGGNTPNTPGAGIDMAGLHDKCPVYITMSYGALAI